MSKNFKLSAVAVALATTTGGAIAAPSPLTGLANDALYGGYDRLLGKEEQTESTNLKRTEYKRDEVSNPAAVTKAANEAATATLVELDLDGDGVNEKYLAWALTDERRAGSEQETVYTLNDTNISAAEEASVDSKTVTTVNGTTLSGTAVNNGVVLQAVVTNAAGETLDAAGNVTTNVAQIATIGNKFRGEDTAVSFTADDLKKVNGATKVVDNYTNTFTTYKAGQALASTNDTKTESVDESNAIAYDTAGKAKQSGGTTDYIVTGVHKDVSTDKVATYQDGKSALAFTQDTTSELSSTDPDYNYKTNAAGEWLDAAGNVTADPDKRVFSFVSADGTTVSDVVTTESKTSNSQKWYQADQEKVYEQTRTGSNKTTTTDVFDGFVSTDESTEQDSFVLYGNAKNVLSFEEKDSDTYATKTREFEKNPDGTLVLKGGKPIVKSVTETNGNSQSEEAHFEESEYTSGTAKDTDTVFRTRAVGGAEGTGASTRFTDSAIASSVNNSENNVTRKDAVDGFVAHNNDKTVDTANYARGLQENIEVARDLVDNRSTDDKDIVRDYTYTTSTGDAVVLKDVSLKIDGSSITAADVREWVTVDTEGKETTKYYVVLGTDLDGREIREEVGYVAGTSDSQTANIITHNVNSRNQNEKVHAQGGKVFYDKTDALSWDNQTIVQGETIGERQAGTNDTTTTLFTRGNGNELDHKVVNNQTWDNQTAYERDGAQIILENGKPVVEQIQTQKGTRSTTTNTYQEGQAKTNETIVKSTQDDKVTDAEGNVLVTVKGHDDNTTVNYAEGEELANTFVRDAATELTAKAQENNAGTIGFVDGEQRGAFNYDGTAKANINSNTLRDNGTVAGGLAVSDAQAGLVTVDVQQNTTNTQDNKVYQDGGIKALEQVAVNTNETTFTYADGTTGKAVNNNSASTTLFNKGLADKYREAVRTSETEIAGKNYQVDEDGDVILVDGKPVEIGTISNKVTATTTENLYQIGQERRTDSVTTTNTANSVSNVDGSALNATSDSTVTNITYREGQADGKAAEASTVVTQNIKATATDGMVADRTNKTNNSTVNYVDGEEFVSKTNNAYDETRQATLADGTVVSDYTFTNTIKADDYNQGEAGSNGGRTLLATHELDSVSAVKRAEALTTVDADGNTVARSIERNNTTTVYADESAKSENVGQSIDTVAGVTSQIDDSQIDTMNKFGNFDATVRSNTVTTTQEDGSAVSNNKTRTDSVNGVELTAKQVVTDKDGKATIVEKGTSVTAGTVATDRVQAPQIVLADRNQQVDANGSIVKEQIKATAATANRLTGQYKVGNDTVYSLRVFKDGKEVTEYFTKNANGQFLAFTGDVKSIEDGSNAPVAGGTTANTDSIETVGKVTNVITDKNVSYGEEVATRGVTTVKGSLNNGEQLEAVVGTTETTVTKQSVTTGIIGQTGTDANKQNVYGVNVTKDNQQTTVTASGVETTGTVKAATVDATNVKATTVDATTVNAGKVVLANNGAIAAGSKEAVSGGQLHTFQTEVKTEIADFKADVNERVRTVNHRLDNVEKTAYRGVAISLAAQQQVPNIKPGQFAVFGGVGHYEGESAIAFGAVSAINDRLSISGAVGTAGSGDVGGRVGASYVFGGN